MIIKVSITLNDPACESPDHRTVITGLEVPFDALTIGDLTDRITETEVYLSRIMGLMVKIETAVE